MIRDLLNPSSGFLDLREDAKGVIQVAGITEVSTINAQEVRAASCPCTASLRSPSRNEGASICPLSDHGAVDEGQQAAHPGAHGCQPDVVPLARRAAGGRQAAEPVPRRPAGGPLRPPLHDRPGRLGEGSPGVWSRRAGPSAGFSNTPFGRNAHKCLEIF